MLLYLLPEGVFTLVEHKDNRDTNREKFFTKGLRFECTRCTRCCRFEPGYVFLSKRDIKRISEELNLKISDFIDTYCRRVWIDGGVKISLKEKSNYDCIFWENGGCRIYNVRPLQCRSFPFWSNFLVSIDTWNSLEKNCPGVNRGRLHSKEIIEYWLNREAKESYFIDNDWIEDL